MSLLPILPSFTVINTQGFEKKKKNIAVPTWGVGSRTLTLLQVANTKVLKPLIGNDIVLVCM